MAAAIGKIGEFDSATEDWASYLERLQCYLLANGVADDKKRDTFLCCVGRETFGLLRALVAPAKPTEKTIPGTNGSPYSSFNTQAPCDSGALPVS